MTLELITVPFNSAGRAGGVAAGPGVLRETGLGAELASRAAVVDRGDVAFVEPTPRRGTSGLLAEEALADMALAVRARVGESIEAGRLPLLIGGDCPVLLGGLAAARDAYGEVGLVFVDGHEDAWPPALSVTGEAADSELGIALGRHVGDLPPRLREQVPLLRADNVIALGPRDERELADSGVPSLEAEITIVRPPAVHELLRDGTLGDRTARHCERLRDTVGHWWLHLDFDVLATDQFRAVDYPQPGGLTWPELDVIVTAALSTRGCVGWSACIYNPDLDPDRSDARQLTHHLPRWYDRARLTHNGAA